MRCSASDGDGQQDWHEAALDGSTGFEPPRVMLA
jgi:hypothetical protein